MDPINLQISTVSEFLVGPTYMYVSVLAVVEKCGITRTAHAAVGRTVFVEVLV